MAREKGPKDLVTEADLSAQEQIFAFLRESAPGHTLLGEESDHQPSPEVGDGPHWIVDPLDGTTNFVHDLPGYAVSVAFREGGQTRAGAIYDPVNNECFVAQLGLGATLNGRPIVVSECTNIHQALMAASFSTRATRESAEVQRFLAVLESSQAFRRMGSAALNLAYVATGRLDGYWASSVKSWDVAAGELIVREAGGITSSLCGGPFDLDHPRLIAACTERLHAKLIDLLTASDPE